MAQDFIIYTERPESMTPLVCGVCGVGHFIDNDDVTFECDDCGHMVTADDIDLEEGEVLVIDAKTCILGYTSPRY